MRESRIIVLASTNKDKFFEFKALLKSSPEIVISPANEYIRNAEKLALVENHDTYLDNAVAKARVANQASHYPSLGDDSGLEVEAMDGRPGVRSHRFAIPKAGQSQTNANIEKLLQELKGKTGEARKARFIASLALVMEGILIHSTGVLEGTITEQPKGTEGFGYDPIFTPKGSDKTLAQMTAAEKNEISHRARALQELIQQMRAKGIILAKP